MNENEAINHYIEKSGRICSIPEIRNGFIPQGLSFCAENDCILITGYMEGRRHSPIYVCDIKNGSIKKILMNTPEGKAFKGHAGGISIYDGMAYVCGSTEGVMYGFMLASIFKADDRTELEADVRLDLKDSTDRMRVSFSAVDDTFLYAGEFHRKPFFRTHKSHLVKTYDKQQRAYLFGFAISDNNEPIPGKVYSIPDKIQGACFDRRHIFLSQTNGLFSARILSYSIDSLHIEKTRNVLGVEVPLYCLTENNAEKITDIPPMSEEIIVVNDKMYILYESAANRYRFGRKMGMEYIWGTDVDFFI